MDVKYFRCIFIFFLLAAACQVDLLAQNSPYSVLVDEKLVSGEPHQTKRFAIDKYAELSVFTPSGHVEIYENPSIEYIQIDLYVNRSFSFFSGWSSLDNYRIVFQKNNHSVMASVEPRRSESKVWSSDNITFSYVIQTPVPTSSRIRSTKGDIRIRNVKGNHMIQVTAGNLLLENMAGETSAYSVSGNVHATNMNGVVNAKTTNGKIFIGNSNGEIRLRSVTGSIEGDNLNGTFIAATTTGNINAELHSMGEGSFIETVSGSVTLTLPRNLNYSIQASGNPLDLSNLLNEQEFVGNVQKNNASVTFGKGQYPVQIQSVTGKVTVRAN